MLDRFTVTSLIKSVIVLMALCMTALLSVSAWNSWGQLVMTGRILLVADASSGFFKALHNLRSDRSATGRNLKEDAVLQPDMRKYMREIRDAELSALGKSDAWRDRFFRARDTASRTEPADQCIRGVGDRIVGCAEQAEGFAPR
jgi:hypothetical protein